MSATKRKYQKDWHTTESKTDFKYTFLGGARIVVQQSSNDDNPNPTHGIDLKLDDLELLLNPPEPSVDAGRFWFEEVGERESRFGHSTLVYEVGTSHFGREVVVELTRVDLHDLEQALREFRQ